MCFLLVSSHRIFCGATPCLCRYLAWLRVGLEHSELWIKEYWMSLFQLAFQKFYYALKEKCPSKCSVLVLRFELCASPIQFRRLDTVPEFLVACRYSYRSAHLIKARITRQSRLLCQYSVGLCWYCRGTLEWRVTSLSWREQMKCAAWCVKYYYVAWWTHRQQVSHPRMWEWSHSR
jgi:hypothetical protein